MGTHLSITKNGEHVTELGRAYHFQKDMNSGSLDDDYDELERQVNFIEEDFIKQLDELRVFVSGREKLLISLLGKENVVDTGETLDNMVHEMILDIRDNSEELMRIGKKQLLSYILEDDSMGYEIS